MGTGTTAGNHGGVADLPPGCLQGRRSERGSKGTVMPVPTARHASPSARRTSRGDRGQRLLFRGSAGNSED